MQIITTGHSMELFFDITFIFLLILSLTVNYRMSKKINKLSTQNEYFMRKFVTTLDSHGEDFDKLHRKIDDLGVIIVNDHDRSLLALRELLEPTKPMKSNNWDSVREAFKGPVRIESNERN